MMNALMRCDYILAKEIIFLINKKMCVSFHADFSPTAESV